MQNLDTILRCVLYWVIFMTCVAFFLANNKPGDVEAVRRLVALRTSSGAAAAFHSVRFCGYANGSNSRELSDAELCGTWSNLGNAGMLFATLEQTAGAISPLQAQESVKVISGQRKTSTEFELLPLLLTGLDLGEHVTVMPEEGDCRSCENSEDVSSNFMHNPETASGVLAHGTSCPETNLRVLVVRAAEISGLIRIDGEQDKPFNPAWDGGRTVLVVEVDGMDAQPRGVQVLTPRGSTLLARTEISWFSPVSTIIQLDSLGDCSVGADPGEQMVEDSVSSHLRTSVRISTLQACDSHSIGAVVPVKSSGAALSVKPHRSAGRGFDPAKTLALKELEERRRSQRQWRQWVPFQRKEPEDFVVQQIHVDYRRSGSEYTVMGALGEASCANYEVYL